MVVRYMYKGLLFSLISAWVICENHAWQETRAPRRCSELHWARAVIEERCVSAAIAAATAPPCQQPHIKTQVRIKNQMVCWCTINFIKKFKMEENLLCHCHVTISFTTTTINFTILHIGLSF